MSGRTYTVDDVTPKPEKEAGQEAAAIAGKVTATRVSLPGTGKTISDAIAANIRKARHRRGWNTAALAARCAEVGAGWLTDGVLRNIEHGRPRDGKRTRDITADEVVALAYAFGMPPAALMPELDQAMGDMDISLFVGVDDMIARLDDMKAWLEDRREQWAAEAAARGEDGGPEDYFTDEAGNEPR